jgi:8-oxo-dGTP pyrophosphatase MutT (NUDIX family)
VTDPMAMPPGMLERARDFRGPPAVPRRAATVVLLQPETLDVYVLKRASTMVFGGVHAFPGGGVDPTDRPDPVRTDWADRLGVPGEQARAVVGAAVRELFEEAGVLLAGPVEQPDRTVGDVSDAGWEADRAAVAARELTLTTLLAQRGLRIRDDLLLPWTRWITPEFEPRRFDTWFFVALLPPGQRARDVSGEASGTTWISPAAADGLAMLPPTRSMLNDLRAYENVVDLVAASAHRDAARAIMPRMELTADGGAVLRSRLAQEPGPSPKA